MTFTLPWPPSSLSPNARHGHWGSAARAKKAYRTACAWTARQQGATRLDAPSLAVTLRFVLPDRRARDIDNLVASMKSGLDGLADVLGVDDSRWRWPEPPQIVEGQIGGFVRVEVSLCPA